jgi:superfamily II DNA or RNA helicase
MAIKIYEHNKAPVAAISKHFKRNDKATVVMTTGIGKRAIATKFLQDRSGHDHKNILIAPSWTTWQLFKDSAPDLARSTVFYTYPGLLKKDIKKILSKHNPKLIVIDEYRRAGAKEWSKPINKIMEAIPRGCKILGTEASPIRYFEGKEEDRNMAIELFGKKGIVYELSRAKAIEKGLIKKPKLVTAIYNVDEILAQSKSALFETGLEKKSKKFKKNWEKSRGVAGILKKHLRPSDYKILVFCKNVETMQDTSPLIKKWFSKVYPGKKITIAELSYLNSVSETHDIVEEFKSAKKADGIHILMTVNKVNDSFHDDNLSVAIQFRETMSPTLDEQQKGRPMSFSSSKSAILFDLVNNIKRIERPIDEAFSNIIKSDPEEKTGVTISKAKEPVFTIVDETHDFVELMQELEDRLSSFAQLVEKLRAYLKKHGRIPPQFENPVLNKFVYRTRKYKKQGKLSKDKIKLFETLGISWEIETLADKKWEKTYDTVRASLSSR